MYLSDNGLLHALLDVETRQALLRHPKLGASWEGFMLESVIQQLAVRRERCFFWATHTGAELDLLVTGGRALRGFEFKRTTTPRITRSMHIAVSDLKLKSLDVVHAGERTFPLSRRIRAVAAHRLLSDL